MENYENMGVILLAIFGSGGIAFLAFYLSRLFSGESDIREAVSKIKQKILKEDIKEITIKQDEKKEEIIEKEKLAIKSQDKIEEIKTKSNEDVKKILDESDIKKTSKEIDDQWKDI